MRESRSTHLLIGLALLLIAGSLALYASLLYRWLSGAPAPAPAPASASSKPEAAPAEDLLGARRRFREGFLDARAHLRLSESLRRAGRPVDAFYVLIAAERFFPEADLRRAHAEVVLGAPAEPAEPPTEEALKERLRQSPEDAEALTAMGRLLSARGEAAAAQKYLDFGLSLHPEDAGLLAAKAAAAGPKSPIAAVPFLARLVHSAPDTYEGRRALDELGRLASAGDSGRDAEIGRLAREGLEELLQVRPQHPGIFSTLATALWTRGEIDSVRAMVSEARGRRPGHAGAARMDGALALREGQADRAVRSFTEAWERDPDDLFSAERLAELHLKQRGDQESALPYLLALHRHDPWSEAGEQTAASIRAALDARRKALLDRAGPQGVGRHLASDDASLRAEACARAGESEDPRWIETLAGLLDDDAGIVRHNADYALFRIAKRHPDAVKARRDAWLSAASPLGRWRLLNLFADLWPQETLPAVLSALKDPSPVLRVLAKTRVLDRYYAKVPAAAKAGADYSAAETSPAARAFLRPRPGPR